MGARIRDDFEQALDKAEKAVTVKEEETATAVYIPALTGNYCLQEVSRNVLWRASTPGSVVSASCPQGTLGLAMRECGESGWLRPHLTQCSSTWLEEVTRSYRADASLPHLTSVLSHNIHSNQMYGGDIIGLFDIVENSLRNFQFHTAGERRVLSGDVLRSFFGVLSKLLEKSAVPAWLDLSPMELEFQRTRFIGLLQEVGLVALTTGKLQTSLQSPNFGKLQQACPLEINPNVFRIFCDIPVK